MSSPSTDSGGAAPPEPRSVPDGASTSAPDGARDPLPGPGGRPAEKQPARDRPGAARRPLRLATFGIIAVAVAAAVVSTAMVVAAKRNSGSGLRTSGLPPQVSTALANQMELNSLPRRPAPDFTLTDQAGRTMSLSSLRGKVVVLEFMDPHCTDICPIVSQEFVDAYHDLGPAAGKVVFAAVNVNQYHASVADVAAFSREHALTSIPDWHFFTGPVPTLTAIWRAYHIYVQAPNPNADVIHTSAVYFIDTRGREAFLASPAVDHTAKGAAFLPSGQIGAWGKGIALTARFLAG